MALLTGTSTSNSSPYTITNTPDSDSANVYKVFDGLNITSGAYNFYPTVNPMPSTITIDFGANVTVESYKLHGHAAPNDELYDLPKDFKLQYSANGTDWTDLDTRTNQTTYTSGASAFSANVTPTEARYWRLYTSATRNARIYLCLSEFELYGTAITPKSVTDSGAGTDTISIDVAITQTDSGTGTDEVGVTVPIAVADSGLGTDEVASEQVASSITDSGLGTDTIGISAPIAITDSGLGTDSLQATATISLSDSGSGVDVIVIVNTVSVSDNGTGSDTIQSKLSKSLLQFQAVKTNKVMIKGVL